MLYEKQDVNISNDEDAKDKEILQTIINWTLDMLSATTKTNKKFVFCLSL